MYFYAVRCGRKPGIYKTWAECEKQIHKFPGSIFKKFSSMEEAMAFANLTNVTNPPKDSRESSPPASVEPARKRLRVTPEDSLKGHNESKKMLTVFTDGSCLSNGKGAAAVAGIGVFFGHNDERNISEALEGIQTNQRAELMAAIRALEVLRGWKGDVEIKTDSQYVINGKSI